MSAPNYDNLSKQDLIELLLARDRDVEANPYRKKYGLIWEDKPEQFDADTVGKIAVLKRDPAKSISSNPDRPTHVLIQGDNYHALKVLAYTHERSVDVIYIDPPYNTGNKDFKYNDKFVDSEDGYRHSKWLSFMAKRLRLAKTLLKESGAIFLSIDENEQAQLKLLCDAVFGEEHFAGMFCWKKRSTGGQAKNGAVIRQIEYVLCYKRPKFQFRRIALADSREKWRDFRKSGGNWQRQHRPKQYFPVFVSADKSVLRLEPFPGSVAVFPRDQSGVDGFWQNGKEEAANKLGAGRLRPVVSSQGELKIQFLESIDEENVGDFIEIPATTGTAELAAFGLTFNNPKPVPLIEHLLALSCPLDATVLDFFAGSGTTANAVMQVNAEDGGTRQCILVTNDEGEFKDEVGKLLPGGICTNVTYPRVKKVIEGYTTPKGKEVAGLRENLAFFHTEFVEDRALERSRKELSARSAEMLCLREACFVEEKSPDKRWRSFTDGHGKRLVVVTDAFAADDLKPLLKADKRDTLVYVFRFGDEDDPAREYGGKGLEHVTAKPVPDSLLALHRRIQRQEAS